MTPNPAEQSILEYLRLQAATRASSSSRSPCPELFALEHGRFFNPAPLPPDVKPGEKRNCFRNAGLLSINNRDRFVYVDGGAVPRMTSPIPVSHAWVVDRAGTVVDPTWPDGGIAYFGVALTDTFYRQRLLQSEMWDAVIYDRMLLEFEGPLDEAVVSDLGRPIPPEELVRILGEIDDMAAKMAAMRLMTLASNG